MKKLLIATRNIGKVREMSKFLNELSLELVSLSNLQIKEDVLEDGLTYKDNSQKKALFYSKKLGIPAIADDGGLEIDALGGEPGIKSRRWLGHEASDQELINHMIKVSKKLPDDNRKAFFKTVVSFALPNGKVWSKEGWIEGIIAREPLMDLIEGYPYRSFFYLPELRKYYHESQLSLDEQKKYNHRYKAIQKLKSIIKNELTL